MKNINWKIRLKNKMFWLAIVPALVLVAQIVMSWFGIQVPAEIINAEAIKIINGVFVVLMLTGVVADPTTKGLSDSVQARNYKEPK